MGRHPQDKRRSDGAARWETRGHMRGGRVHDHHGARNSSQPRPPTRTIWHRLAKTTAACYRAADNDATDADSNSTRYNDEVQGSRSSSSSSSTDRSHSSSSSTEANAAPPVG